MIQVKTLSNGIRLIIDANPQSESVSFGAWVAVGSRFETPEINGISHVLEHMAFKGTEKRTAFDISREVEDVGGIVNAYTGKDMTAYYVKMLKKDWQLGLDIIADILQHSRMDAEELEREKGVIIQEINMNNDQPDEVVFDMYNEKAYPDQPFGRTILGKPENVRAVTGQKLLDYMHRQYTTGRMVLSVSGAVDSEAIIEACEKAFMEIMVGEETIAEPARYVGGDVRRIKEHEQVNLILGFESGGYSDPDYYATSLLAAVLGGGMSSRLFQEIREKRGLVYSICAYNSPSADTGTFGIYAGTGEKEVAELMPVLCDEILKLPVSVMEEELARVKNQAVARVLMRQENWSSHAESNAIDMITHGRVITTEEAVQKLEAVQKEDLIRLSHKIFCSVPTVAALGPVGQVMPYDEIVSRLKHA